MLTAPADLAEDALVATLARGWAVTVVSMAYRPVGFGSHHWEIVDTGGTRWFLTVDELENKRHSRRESMDAAFDRLRASLAAASGLRDCGRTFAVAPVPTLDGQPLVRMGDRFGVALYPFVDGRSFRWGEFIPPEHRLAVLDLVIGVHTAPEAVRRHAMADDFAIPHRDELEAALRSADGIADRGPYARPTALLLAEYAEPIRGLLARYDALVAEGRAQPSRAVLTHGEPHPGNTVLTAAGGWRLVDWDTVLVAPPERDLWILAAEDGSVPGAYADATGVTPLPSMLGLYRIRWDLADIAAYVGRFRRPHTGNPDDDKSWRGLCTMIPRIDA